MPIDTESLSLILDQINNNHRDFKKDVRGDLERLRMDLNSGLKKKHEYTDAKIVELKIQMEKEIDENKREIRGLNKFKWKLTGMSVVIIAIFQTIFNYLTR